MKHGKFEISKGYQPRFGKEIEKDNNQVQEESVRQERTTQTARNKKIRQAKEHKMTVNEVFSGFTAKFKRNKNSEENQEEPVKKNKKTTGAVNTLDYLRDFVFLLSGVLLVLLLLFRIVVVSGSSMRNTLLNGDYIILLSNAFYDDYKQGDVVVASKEAFKSGEPIIKRVIATEGQEVNIDFDEGIVYVDGQPLDEEYVLTPTNRDEGIVFPLVVEEGCVFVLGDNRNASKDSRNPEIGQIDCREILGKAVFILLPGIEDISQKRDFSRIGVIS